MSDPNSKTEDHAAGHGENDLAVALGYDLEAQAAPKVVAKGKGEIARRICEIAQANGIPVRRDADLVELLSAMDVDQEIPLEAFAAVAEILAYIYRANGRLPSAETQAPPEKATTI